MTLAIGIRNIVVFPLQRLRLSHGYGECRTVESPSQPLRFDSVVLRTALDICKAIGLDRRCYN